MNAVRAGLVIQNWWYGVVVSTASINKVNLRRTWLVLRWATMSGDMDTCQLSLPSLRGW